MKRYAIVSYNLYCNFTNYGSALQQYALHRVVNELAPTKIESIILDYCPDVLADKDVLNPFKNMWDQDEESRKNAELTMPAIRENYKKFKKFFEEQYKLSNKKYTSTNFNESLLGEHLDGYICGSDTIWCILEFGGFDDGYFGNYEVMKNSHTIAYAASFGDAQFNENDLRTLRNRLQNYKAIGVRESTNIELIRDERTDSLVERVLDPTLLLTGKDYDSIVIPPKIEEPYILLYTRRYNPNMQKYAEKMAKEQGCRLVEISLMATNADKGHLMRYDAGVEEFLGLVKNAKHVITNSFHGVIFAIQMHTQFSVFSREQADTKIDELLDDLNITGRKYVTGLEENNSIINYDEVERVLEKRRAESLEYLKKALNI